MEGPIRNLLGALLLGVALPSVLLILLFPRAFSPTTVALSPFYLLRIAGPPIFSAAATLLAVLGAGSILFRILSAWEERFRLSLAEDLLASGILGLLAMSQLLFLMGLLSRLDPGLLYAVQAILVCVGVVHIRVAVGTRRTTLRDAGTPRAFAVTSPILQLLVLAALYIFVLSTLTSPALHPDALQYHFALPKLFLQNGAIHHYETLPGSGTYLGSELLYMLTLQPAHPETVYASKLLNLFLGSLLFAAIYISARRAGAPRLLALLAILMMLSVDAIGRWGYGKNDMLSAGLGVASLWLFLVYRTLHSTRWIPVLGLVAGYAVSVKLTNVLVPALLALAFLLLEGRDRYRNVVRFLFFAALPLVAWTGFAYYTRGTPFYPVGQHLPEYMQKAAAARNANGLHFTILQYARFLIPLILSPQQLIRGSDPLGWFFLLAIPVGAILLMWSDGRRAWFFYVTGAVQWFMLSAWLFEGRLLTRYLLLAPASIFVFVAAASSSYCRQWPRMAAVLCLALGALAVMEGPSIRTARNLRSSGERALYVQGRIDSSEQLRSSLGSAYTDMLQYVNGHVKQDEKVLINDAMVFYLKVPFINVHALHSTYIRYDRVDVAEFGAIMSREHVVLALIRRGISGIMPVLDQYLDRNMALVQRLGPFELYQQGKRVATAVVAK